MTSFREPIVGLTHLAGALLGIAGFFFLLGHAHGDKTHVVAFAIFASSLVLLYTSSGMYHLLKVSYSTRVILRRLDHTMIFVLIAGSYTPFCLIPLSGPTGWTMLLIVWIVAGLGLIKCLIWVHGPRFIRTGMYLAMGYIMLAAILPLMRALTPQGFAWLLAGGACYSIGAMVYAFKRPNLFPPHFNFHELWHLFVLAGSTCHFLSVATL